MTYLTYRFLILSDLYRLTTKAGGGALLKSLLFGGAFKYNFWMRTCQFTKSRKLLRFTIYPFARLMLTHLMYKFGISIPPNTKIGSGFYIGHFGGIVVNSQSVIGKNCNISHGVTLGKGNRGKNKGYPMVGDNVYIGPGAKIIGGVKIGNHVAIGANCVVTKDVPDYAVVVGVPGKVISNEGSEGYVNNTDYERVISGSVKLVGAVRLYD